MKNLLYIGNKLSKHGFSVTSIETLGPLFESEGFSVTYASEKKNKIFRLLDMVLKTISLRKKTDYIIIDTYSTSNFWFSFFVSQTARFLKIKYIPILRGGDLPKRLQKSKRICRMIFSNSYKNVAPSKYLFEAFRTCGFLNTIYIPNTIELKNYPFKKRSIVSPKLLWVRSFAEIYNPKMAIEVVAILRNTYPKVALSMVGPEKDGSMVATKKLAQEYGIDVNFTGKLSKTQWTLLSENHDIFINTTHFDNTPVSVMEAMALGLPIVSTNVGGIPFLLENTKTAILVPDGNATEMAEAIKNLCNNATLSEMLSTNARNHSENFDWSVVKSQWKEILI